MQTCRILIAVITLCLLAACATFKNTPQQDYVFAVGKICDTNGRFRLDWVSADGKRWRTNTADSGFELPAFMQCMREQSVKYPYREWLEQHKADYDAAVVR